ncbi:MAG: TRAP transporter small permease subunit [Robiginitomaculum sp.]
MSAQSLEIFARILTAIGWVFLPLALLPLAQLLLPKSIFISSLTRNLVTIIDGVSNGLGEAVKWALPLLVIAIVVSIIGLSIFGISFTKLDELPVYLHASLIMLGSAATLLAGQHVRVDIFHSRFSPKRRAMVDIIGFYALIMPVCLIILWTSQSFVAGSWASFEGSSDSDGIRGVFYLKTLLPLFAVMMLMQGAAIAGRAAHLRTGHALPPRPRHIAPLFEKTGEKQ